MNKETRRALNDTQVMENVRDGKVEQLAILFERHHVSLFNFFLRLTGSRPLSEDLVQDVFCRILKYRHSYRGTSKFTTWLYQIARNAHIDHLRKQKSTLPLEEQWDEPPSSDPIPENKFETGTEIALLQRAMSRLPVKRREILILSRFHGMKYREIANLMDCQIGTVKAHVHRAVKELGRIYFELSGGSIP